MKLENTIHDIRMAMWKYGGSFVHQLSNLLSVADLENQDRIFKAWPELFERYDALATSDKAKQPELIQ